MSMSDDDIYFFCRAIESLDLPKDPIAWLMVRLQEKAHHYRMAGDEPKASDFDNRAGGLRVLLRNTRIATIGDERKNPEFFKPSVLDRLLAAQPHRSTAQARTEIKQILARRKAKGLR